ncbi:MAG: hypothetical protein A2Y38_12955 [Spirochaetes bacterium GWB1_59_5]|nr:MAG: hypothetical protein A2Y38_12955 [Spirochaetes bacterium GWB1_59_5]
MADLTLDNVTVVTNVNEHNTTGNATIPVIPPEYANVAAEVYGAMADATAVRNLVLSKPTV